MNFKTIISKYYIPLFLASLPFFLFWDVLFGTHMFGGDSPVQDFPLRYYYGLKLVHGYFPLWTPELNFGHPFFAEIHTGLLYLPNVVFSLVAYWGGLLYGLHHFLRSGSSGKFSLLCLFISMSFLAGSPPVFFMQIVLMIIYTIFSLLSFQINRDIYRFVFDNIPAFGMFRVPGRYLLFSLMAIAWLSGTGFDMINKKDQKPNRFLGLVLILFFLALIIIPFYKNKLYSPIALLSFSKASIDMIFIATGLVLLWMIFGYIKNRTYTKVLQVSLIIFLIVGNMYYNRRVVF
jgi:hypothetical protein